MNTTEKCFKCGSRENLLPYRSFAWGMWRVCKLCSILAAKERKERYTAAIERQQKQRQGRNDD